MYVSPGWHISKLTKNRKTSVGKCICWIWQCEYILLNL